MRIVGGEWASLAILSGLLAFAEAIDNEVLLPGRHVAIDDGLKAELGSRTSGHGTKSRRGRDRIRAILCRGR